MEDSLKIVQVIPLSNHQPPELLLLYGDGTLRHATFGVLADNYVLELWPIAIHVRGEKD